MNLGAAPFGTLPIMATYRYHLIHPVEGSRCIERPFGPTPQGAQPGGAAGIEFNIKKNRYPIFVPWTNIAYVERWDCDNRYHVPDPKTHICEHCGEKMSVGGSV